MLYLIFTLFLLLCRASTTLLHFSVFLEEAKSIEENSTTNYISSSCETDCCQPSINPIASSRERTLNGLGTLVDGIMSLQYLDVSGHFTSLSLPIFGKIQLCEFLRSRVRRSRRGRVKERLKTIKDDNILDSKTLFATPKETQNMIGADFKVYEENRLQQLLDDTVEKNVLNLFEEAHGKALIGTYTKLCQTV